jgi:hypothetical protein
MNTETVAMIAAGLGVAGSIVWLVLGFLGLRTLRDVRDHLARR